MALKLKVILGSTRSKRQGEKVFEWVKSVLAKHKEYDVQFIDLKDWNMPYFPFPESPAMKRPEGQLADRWAKTIADGDAFVIITPEYNHGYSAVLKNALDFTYYDWNNKPVSFVAYSMSPLAGARVVEQLRLVAIELQMAPIREAVYIPAVHEQFDDQGNMKTDRFNKALDSMLRQLEWWGNALKSARQESGKKERPITR